MVLLQITVLEVKRIALVGKIGIWQGNVATDLANFGLNIIFDAMT